MSLGAHLIELRNRLFIAAIAVAAAMAAGLYLTPWVWSMLRKPLDEGRWLERVERAMRWPPRA